MKPRLAVTEADRRSGNCCTIFTTNSPYLALYELNLLRSKSTWLSSTWVYGVHDIDNPERGDVQDRLEEVLTDPDAAREWDKEESCRILAAAKYAALDAIVERGVGNGIAIGANPLRAGTDLPSIYDAVNAYYVARRAYEVASNE